jgi:hypothetical protein
MKYYIVFFSNKTKTWNLLGKECNITEIINTEETQLNGILDDVNINLVDEQVNRFAVINCTLDDVNDKLGVLNKISELNGIFNGNEWICELFVYNIGEARKNNNVLIHGEGLHFSRCFFNSNTLKFNTCTDNEELIGSNFEFSLN